MVSLLASFLVLATPTSHLGGSRTPWDPIFQVTHIKPSDVQLAPKRWREGGEYALTRFNALWDDWQKVEPFAQNLADQLLSSVHNPEHALEIAAKNLDVQPTKEQAIQITSKVDIHSLPINEGPVTNLLTALATAKANRLKSFPWLSEKELQSARQEILDFALSYDDGGLGPHCLDLMSKTNLSPLATSAEQIAKTAASETYKLKLNSHQLKFSGFSKTSLGNVRLIIGDDQTVNANDSSLILVFGNRNTIEGLENDQEAVQLVYAKGDGNTFKTKYPTIFGISEIISEGSHNHFEGPIGGAVCGISTVICTGGENTFLGKDLCQGAATCGIGLILAAKGGNHYDCRAESEGFAGVRGFGALVDAEGNDTYTANDTLIDNPSPQTAQHNVSLSQGAGFGRRAHPGDHHSMAGGIGILANGGGHNAYQCGVFGQGVAYWFSIGALVNKGGDNTFNGVWYVQGSAAHYAIGVNLIGGAKNKLTVQMAQSQGQGHDYSIGILHLHGGNTVYEAAGGCLGSGRYNGIGLFASDQGGNTFTYGGECLGALGESRPEDPCFGFFAARGTNTYKGPGHPARTWITKNQTKPVLVVAGGCNP